jgi:small subunit ribosomal protein S1
MTRKGLDATEGQLSTEQQDFAQLLASFDYAFHRGDLVKGTVVGYESGGVLVDIGAKTAAYMPAKELGMHGAKLEDVLKTGDTHEFLIMKEENEEGQLTVSLRRVQAVHNWKKLETMMQDETVIECAVSAVVKGGLLVEVMELRGFVPASHLRVKQSIESLVGQTLPLKILNLDVQRNNIILSHRKVMSEQMAEQRKELFENLQVGAIVEGEVVRLTDFGAFVDLGGVDGLLPLSQMSWRWVEHPSDVLKIGDHIKVEVIGLDMERQRVSLSIKSQFSDPWNDVANEFKVGQETTGTITRIKHFGAFVEVYPGVEALLPSKDIVDYENFHKTKLDVGHVIQTSIQKFNPEERRISLAFTTNVEGGPL